MDDTQSADQHEAQQASGSRLGVGGRGAEWYDDGGDGGNGGMVVMVAWHEYQDRC